VNDPIPAAVYDRNLVNNTLLPAMSREVLTRLARPRKTRRQAKVTIRTRRPIRLWWENSGRRKTEDGDAMNAATM